MRRAGQLIPHTGTGCGAAAEERTLRQEDPGFNADAVGVDVFRVEGLQAECAQPAGCVTAVLTVGSDDQRAVCHLGVGLLIDLLFIVSPACTWRRACAVSTGWPHT